MAMTKCMTALRCKETVGNTPCVKISDEICPKGRTIYAKLEYFNPLSSVSRPDANAQRVLVVHIVSALQVKDRLACAIIEAGALRGGGGGNDVRWSRFSATLCYAAYRC